MSKLLASFQTACQFLLFAKTEKSLPRCIKYDPRFDDKLNVSTTCSLHYELVATSAGDRSHLQIVFSGDALRQATIVPTRYMPVVVHTSAHTADLGMVSFNKAGQKLHDFNHGYPLSEILKGMDVKDPILKRIVGAEDRCCYMQKLPEGRYDIFPEDKNEAGRCTRLRDFGALAI